MSYNTTTTTQFSTVNAREVDFVTRFGQNWEALKNIIGITNSIRKTPGTKLVAYTSEMADDAFAAQVGEGEKIGYTKFTVKEAATSDITIEKYAKSVSVEAVAKYGAAIAVQKTDDQFLVELQNIVLGRFYNFLNTGTLTGEQSTWQRALAIAKGAVLDKFAAMNKTVTDVVGFANIYDFYDYVGSADITVQTAFGLQYVKDFLGYSTLFLLPDKYVASTKVIACPVENIDLYYVDPSDSDFAKLGLTYTVEGETNLLGFHAEGDYSRAAGDAFAIMGMELWAEYLDGIAVITVGNSDVRPTNFKDLTVNSVAGTNSGDTKITVSGAPARTSYVYSVGTAKAAVKYDDVLTSWTAWDGESDITAESGKVITVAAVTSAKKARGAGNATVVAKA